jgi:hypothetical protein
VGRLFPFPGREFHPLKAPGLAWRTEVGANGVIKTIAGTGVPGVTGDGGPATAAEIDSSFGFAVITGDAAGNIYFINSSNAPDIRIRRIDKNGTISTYAGNGIAGSTGDGGPATSAEVWPGYILFDPAGRLLLVEGARIRAVGNDGKISSLAGNGSTGFAGDGGPAYPFGEGHTFAGVNCVVDWMHEQDVVPVRAS